MNRFLTSTLLLLGLLGAGSVRAQRTPNPLPECTAGPTACQCHAEASYELPPDTPPDTTPGVLPTEIGAFLDALEAQAPFAPSSSICVPSVGGLIFGQNPSDTDWPPPDSGIVPSCPEDSPVPGFPAGTHFDQAMNSLGVDCMRDLFSEADMISLLQSWSVPAVPFDADLRYQLDVQNVDTSEFPFVTIRLKVFLYDPEPPSFSVAIGQNLQVSERVLTEESPPDGSDPGGLGNGPAGPAEVGPDSFFLEGCSPPSPVLMSVVLDTSGSMKNFVKNPETGVIPNAKDYVDWVLGQGNPPPEVFVEGPPSPGDDQVAFITFSSSDQRRAPNRMGAGEADAFAPNGAAGFDAEYQNLLETDANGNSPIFQQMKLELDRLVGFENQDCTKARFLVTMSDFLDNASSESDRTQLVETCRQEQIKMANLLMGDPGSIEQGGGDDNAEQLATETGGIVVTNGSFKPRKVFYDLHMGAARTYCLRYKTGFARRVNEVVEVDLTLPGGPGWAESKATARYLLPVVVPEDTPEPVIQLPVSEQLFITFGNLGADLSVTGTLTLANPAGVTAPARPGFAPPAAGEDPQLEFKFASSPLVTLAETLPPLEEGGEPRPLHVLELRASNMQKPDGSPFDWNSLFQTPTFPLTPSDDPAAPPPVTRGTHFRARLELENLARSGGAGCKTLGAAPILAVQDRTPPTVLLEMRPSTGAPPSHLQFFAAAPHQDPWPLGESGEVTRDPEVAATESQVSVAGYGTKRARLAGEWFDPNDAAVAGLPFEDVHWLQAEVTENGAPFPDHDSAALPPFNRREGGFYVNAGVRTQVLVRARDNYAALEHYRTSVPDLDTNVWLEAVDPASTTPAPWADLANRTRQEIHAATAEGDHAPEGVAPDTRNVLPPFLPLRTREFLDATENASQAGVTWWISSRIEGDVYDQIEHIEDFRFSFSDLEEMERNPDVVDASDPNNPLRLLHVWARDEHGNSTRFAVKLEVRESDFVARTIQSSGGRAN